MTKFAIKKGCISTEIQIPRNFEIQWIVNLFFNEKFEKDVSITGKNPTK